MLGVETTFYLFLQSFNFGLIVQDDFIYSFVLLHYLALQLLASPYQLFLISVEFLIERLHALQSLQIFLGSLVLQKHDLQLALKIPDPRLVSLVEL